ncbi:MAG: Isochorismate synthase MenF [Saprospiraceae bacterium]|nr:Isochorismate synthase MenF [Saprospiraceae bacterium]
MNGFLDYPIVLREMTRLHREGIPFLFAVNYDKTEGFCLPTHQISPEQILYHIGPNPVLSTDDRAPIDLAAHPIPYPDYHSKYLRVQEHIRQGNTYLCNLTQPTPIIAHADLKKIYKTSAAPYKLWVRDRFVVFSPEPFIRLSTGVISSFPMKGTARADDEGSEAALREDHKESPEHNTIVDLLRNDLSIVAKNVHVKRLKYCERIKTMRGDLLQMSSEISGNIRAEYANDLGSLFDRLLPAGSVTGAPKLKTVNILSEIEGYQRNYYTGVFGLFDGATLTSAVMIRFIEQTETGLVYKSGGGITALSDPEKEYQELLQKIYVPVF